MAEAGFLVDEHMRLAVEFVQLGLAAGLAVILREAIGHRVIEVVVGGALDQQRRRQLGGLAALQGELRIALGHGGFIAEIGQMRVEETLDVLLLRHAVARQRVEHRPAAHDETQPRVEARGARQRPGQGKAGVAFVARPHRAQHQDLPAARRAEPAHLLDAAAEPQRVGLEPARRQVHVGHGGGIGIRGRHAEIDRHHQNAATRQMLVERGVVEPVAIDPGAAMHLDQGGDDPARARPVKPRQHRLAADALVLDVFDVDLETRGRAGRIGRHGAHYRALG